MLDLEDPEEGRADQHQRAREDVAGDQRTCHSLIAAAAENVFLIGISEAITVPGTRG